MRYLYKLKVIKAKARLISELKIFFVVVVMLSDPCRETQTQHSGHTPKILTEIKKRNSKSKNGTPKMQAVRS